MKKEDLDALAGLYEGVYSPAESGEYLVESPNLVQRVGRGIANSLRDLPSATMSQLQGQGANKSNDAALQRQAQRGKNLQRLLSTGTLNKPAAKPSALAGRVSSTTDIAALRRGQEQARKDQLAKASKAPKPAPPTPGAGAKVAPTAATKPKFTPQTGDKAKDTATWAKANPTLAAASAERARIRGTQQTDNPLMKDMKSRLPMNSPSVQSPSVSNLGQGNQSLVNNPNALKAATPKPSTTPKKPMTQTQSFEWPSAKTIRDIADAYVSIYEGKKKDQDQDGDNDFADVRIARMIASGMSKAEAIAAVKNKEYNEEFELDEAAKRTLKKTRGVKPSDKEWQKGRSDAGKRISGDEDTGPRYYTLGRSRGAEPDSPTAPGKKPKNTPKLAGWEKDDIQYRKANLKAGKTHKVGGEKGLPEEYEIYEIVASYLLENNFAETINDANVIIENMSENWLEEILEAKKPLPVSKMKRKESKLLDNEEGQLKALRTDVGSKERKARMKELQRFDNINSVRTSFAKRGGKQQHSMPEIGRYKPKDED
jgi:hypothetical protein